MQQGWWAGVDIGGTKTAVVLSCAPPEIVCRQEFATEPELGPEPAIHRIIAALKEILGRKAQQRILSMVLESVAADR